MPFQDAELDSLARSRDIYRDIRDTKKQRLDQAYTKHEYAKGMLNPRIDSLGTEHDRLYSAMIDAYSRASNAFTYKDHEGAKYWSDEGRRSKAEMNDVTAERRQLIDQMRVERTAFHDVRDAYRAAKADYERYQDAFQARLEWLKQDAVKRRAERDRGRSQAGVKSTKSTHPGHGPLCDCKRCGSSSTSQFERTLSDGSIIYGDKTQEGRRPNTPARPRGSYKHGHDWDGGGRVPHDNLGHAAVEGARCAACPSGYHARRPKK